MVVRKTQQVVDTLEGADAALKPTFVYFELRLKLLREQLGTCTEASIYEKHVQAKAKKEITQANRLATRLAKNIEKQKVAKSQQKYVGVEFPDSKATEELHGILRSYMERTGVKHELPSDPEGLIAVAAEIKEEWEEMMAEEGGSAPTVFMRDKDGHAVISSHMILGNIKENLRIITNNGDKSVATSKVSVGEMGTLDIKPIESFLKPSLDVMRQEDGTPQILERPIRFDRMGKTETAICRSETIPAGAEYTCTLRVRGDSPLAHIPKGQTQPPALWKLLELGKNNGIGQWRGSGNKGAYAFQLKLLENYKDPTIPEGWN